MNLCVPPFPMPLPFLPFVSIIHFGCASLILIFISVFCTHIIPLLLSCSHHFHSTACTYKPLLSLYHSRSPAAFFLFFPGFVVSRVVIKISSCQVSTTSRWGIKHLGVSFGSNFLLFSIKSSWGPHS